MKRLIGFVLLLGIALLGVLTLQLSFGVHENELQVHAVGKAGEGRTSDLQSLPGKIYPGPKTGHWISKNDKGKIITLEDRSRWEVDPLERITSMLWLPVSDITIGTSNKGFPGYDYLLINKDDKEQVHAKYLGK